MNPRDRTAELEIARGVGKCGGELTWVSGSDSRFTLTNGRTLEVSARLDPEREWLHLDADPGFAHDETAGWRALIGNARLSGLAKLALAGTVIRLRAELPLERTEAVASRVAAACGGFKDALASFENTARAGAAPSQESGRLDAAHLAAMRDAGWPIVQRPDGSAVAELSCGRRFHQASIEPRSAGGVLVAAPLLRHAAPLSGVSRRAIATFLLSLTGGLRLARAVAIESGEAAEARLEVAFDAPPDVRELHHALSALSVGCTAAGDETRALAHDAVASRYLEALD